MLNKKNKKNTLKFTSECMKVNHTPNMWEEREKV